MRRAYEAIEELRLQIGRYLAQIAFQSDYQI